MIADALHHELSRRNGVTTPVTDFSMRGTAQHLGAIVARQLTARKPRLDKLADQFFRLHGGHLTPLRDYHRPHVTPTCDAREPAWNGYLLTAACPCGVVFERWVTPADAELDLLHFARLN